MPFIEDIEVESVPLCPVCSTQGQARYPALRDHTFGAPGSWGMKRCAACSLVWLDPRPTPSDIAKVYRTYYTHGVTAAGAAFQMHVRNTSLSRRLLQSVTGRIRKIQDAVLAVRFGYSQLRKGPLDALLAWTLGFLPGMGQGASMQVLGLKASERGTILDIGCGNGAFLARMQSLGWNTFGHEMDTVAAKFAREHFGLAVKEGLLDDAGYVAGSFDVVTLSHVIEHVHSPSDIVAQCSHLLSPGGKLIVLTPNVNGIGHRVFREAWRGLEPPRHIHCFNARTLRACVERGGMTVRCLSTPSRMMRAIWYASRLVQRADRGKKMSNNAFDYLAAYAMQIIEGLVCRTGAHVGEEVMLIAIRPELREAGRP